MTTDVPLPAGLRPGGRFAQWQAAPVGWLASDVDGTLLGPDDQVTDAVAAAMVAVAETGTPVGLVTGRMRQGAQRIHDRLPVAGPHVLHNGAEVRFEGVTIASWPLTADEVAILLDIAMDHNAYGEFYTSEAFLVTRTDNRASAHWDSLQQYPRGIVTPASPPGEQVLKATFIGFDEAETAALQAAFEGAGMTVGNGISLAHGGWTYLNVTAPGVDKSHAIRAAAEHLGIGLEQVAMIGDGHNDLPALRVVGTAIAMGQSGDDVKEVAHLVTDDVTADGVVVALRALGLLPG